MTARLSRNAPDQAPHRLPGTRPARGGRDADRCRLPLRRGAALRVVTRRGRLSGEEIDVGNDAREGVQLDECPRGLLQQRVDARAVIYGGRKGALIAPLRDVSPRLVLVEVNDIGQGLGKRSLLALHTCSARFLKLLSSEHLSIFVAPSLTWSL